MRSDRAVPVAIVGGGFSGTILAAQLARRGVDSVLIDGSGRAGKGVAYSTNERAHLLNVPADGMSAWPDQPDHFAEQFESEGGERRDFAPRKLFGQYAAGILEDAVESGHTRVIDAWARAAKREDHRWRVELDDGTKIDAQAIALATGNQEPEPIRPFDEVPHRFVANPWGAHARAAVDELAAAGGDTLLVGTGLTMIDVVLSLDSSGYRGTIVALSRRGLIPRAHADYEPVTIDPEEVPQGRVGAILQWLRRRSAETGWRAAVDSLRPHSHALWQGLGSHEQRRFLRHARPWWDVHRHRIAPQVAATLRRLVGEDRLRVIAGRVIAARERDALVEVDIRRRGTNGSERKDFAYAFNCTGPLHSIERTRDSLLRSLLDAKQVRPDHLGMGLEVDGNCRAGERLWALGPLTKGRYWEIIAVPDIRGQAAAVAEDMAREMQG